jgi:hypothetical protein
MALPPAVIGAIGAAASHPKVQQIAERLLRDAYERMRGNRPPEPSETTPDPLTALLETLPTREEIAAQFALMQAEAEVRERRMRQMIAVLLVGQALTIAVVLFG